MKIVHIIDSGGFGGAERYIIDVVSYMANRDGINVEVITFVHNELFCEIANEKGVVVNHLIKNSNKSIFKIFMEILRIYRKDKDTIFHTHGYKANILVRCSLFLTKAKLVTTVHSTLNYWNSKCKSTLYKYLDMLTSVRNNTIICVSDYIKSYYKTPFNKSKLMTIYNGVDSSKYNTIKSVDFGHRITAVNAGSLNDVKNQITIIKAFAYLVQKLNVNNIELIIIGDGPNKQGILDFINRNKLSKYIKLVGFKTNVIDYLLQSDVYISSSTDESFGLSIVEAMMLGLPVISSSVGGVPEIIPSDDYGLLYQNPFDEIELATKIKKLIENEHLARIIAKNGCERAKDKFTLEKLCDSLLSLYKKVK
jgi:glycosyltransferase involved in cell wall biosynthesis